jgi:hypothetical protein
MIKTDSIFITCKKTMRMGGKRMESNQITALLAQAASNKAKALLGYEKLLVRVPDPKMKEILNGIIQHEQRHLEMLSTVLSQLAGKDGQGEAVEHEAGKIGDQIGSPVDQPAVGSGEEGFDSEIPARPEPAVPSAKQVFPNIALKNTDMKIIQTILNSAITTLKSSKTATLPAPAPPVPEPESVTQWETESDAEDRTQEPPAVEGLQAEMDQLLKEGQPEESEIAQPKSQPEIIVWKGF